MSFFRPFLQFANTESNISNVDRHCSIVEQSEYNSDSLPLSENTAHEGENTQEAGVVFSQPEHEQENLGRPANSPFIRTRKRKHSNETSPQPSSSVDKILTYLENRQINQNSNHDDVDLICLTYARTIKKFSPRRQTLVKFKISELLMKEELAQHDMESDVYFNRPTQQELNSYPSTSSASPQHSTDGNLTVECTESENYNWTVL